MNLLLVSAHFHDPGGPHHGQRRHLRVRAGVIEEIFEGELPAKDVDEHRISATDLHISAGWLDLSCVIGEPGHEARETFETAARAAVRGGFTDVVLHPDAPPFAQTRATVAYVRQQSVGLPVRFHPVAPATVDAAGQDLTEMHDLRAAGAVAFGDGPTHPLQRAETLVRALQYAAPLGAVIFNRAEHGGLSEGGQVHESAVSVRLGLRGLPALAEDIQLARDLRLLEYAGGRLHVSSVSTVGGVSLLRDAKARGLAVTADVAAHQFAFLAEEIPPFDTRYKVRPPFRDAADRAALLEGLADGTLDAVTSAHQPHDPESKELEFDLAEFGAIGLETAFSAVLTYAPGLDLDALLLKLSQGPRAVLSWAPARLVVGQPARLTLFDPTAGWTPTPDNTLSKARNSPFYGHTLRGRVVGTITETGFSAAWPT